MNGKEWNKLIAKFPRAHLLQTWQWGQAKQSFNWKPHYKTWQDDAGNQIAAAQILERQIRLPLIGKRIKMFYVPKGPLLIDWHDLELRTRVLTDLSEFAQEQSAFLIKMDPDVALGYGMPGTEEEELFDLGQAVLEQLSSNGWRYSNEQVQMPNTMLIDLQKSEDELLAAMKQKTRYNIRLGTKKGLTVRVGDPNDFEGIYQMYVETSLRDKFVIRNRDYYHTVWETFFTAGYLKPLIAEFEGQAIAALMLFIFDKQAWYIYGMSTSLFREKMPNYLLQWEAIRIAKEAGCEVYDLWGAPDLFNESDPMWGVYRFKKGLAAYEARYIGAWDLPIQASVYNFYSQLLPRLVALMRLRGKRQTRAQMNTGFDH